MSDGTPFLDWIAQTPAFERRVRAMRQIIENTTIVDRVTESRTFTADLDGQPFRVVLSLSVEPLSSDDADNDAEIADAAAP